MNITQIIELKPVIELILVFLAGGFSQAILRFLIARKKESRIDFQTILTTLHNENKALQAANESLVKRIANLEAKVTLLEAAHQDIPLPMWLKDLDGTMLAVNPAYEETFLQPIGKTASDYIGRMDEEIWGKELADQFAEYDKLAIRNRVVDEDIFLEINGSKIPMRLIKYVRKVGRIPVGVAGLAILHNKVNGN